jgi:hypothetical protein
VIYKKAERNWFKPFSSSSTMGKHNTSSLWRITSKVTTLEAQRATLRRNPELLVL